MSKFFTKSTALKMGPERIFPGERKQFSLDLASLYDYTPLNIPIEVIRGKEPGPVLFVSAAIHGDEINGVEIIKRLLQRPALKKIKGTLIAVPVVNVFGFNSRSRYLPDRRDLNRSFPGTKTGSLASRIAYVFMKEVVSKCTHGIDLHTGAKHRSNLPQVRAFIEDAATRDLATCFGAPLVIHSALRDGSLREAARKRKVRTLLYEGGEALRHEEDVIRVGVSGCLAVMRKIGMLPEDREEPHKKVRFSHGSAWVRAPHSGSFRSIKKLGEEVQEGEVLAVITDVFGGNPFPVHTEEAGVIVGMITLPLVNQGDAMFHVAQVGRK